MITRIDDTIVCQRGRRCIVIERNAPTDRVRALVAMGCSEGVAQVFVHSSGARTAIVQLAQRLRLINS